MKSTTVYLLLAPFLGLILSSQMALANPPSGPSSGISESEERAFLESKLVYTEAQGIELTEDLIFLLNEKQSRFQFVRTESRALVKDLHRPVVFCANFLTIRDKKTGYSYFARLNLIGVREEANSATLATGEAYIVGGHAGAVNRKWTGEENESEDEDPISEFLERHLDSLFSSYVNSKIIDDFHPLPQYKSEAAMKFKDEMNENPLLVIDSRP